MENVNRPRYDLEFRTLNFAVDVRRVMAQLPVYIHLQDDIRQLIRCSGSIGANYIEANEAYSKKDFHYRLRLSRKEAKESSFWLSILNRIFENHDDLNRLLKESDEIKKILSSIIVKTGGKNKTSLD